MEDMRAVLEAVGSERAVVVGGAGGRRTWPRSTRRPTPSGPRRSFSSSSPPTRPGGSKHPDWQHSRERLRTVGNPGPRRRDAGRELSHPAPQRGRPPLVRELAAGRREPGDRARAQHDLCRQRPARGPALDPGADARPLSQRPAGRGRQRRLRSHPECPAPPSRRVRWMANVSLAGDRRRDRDHSSPLLGVDAGAGERAGDRALHRPSRLDREGGRAGRPALARGAGGAQRAGQAGARPLSRRSSWTPPATGSSPASTARRARSAAPARSARRCGQVDLEVRCGTPHGRVRAARREDHRDRCLDRRTGGVSRRRRARCSSPGRSRTSSPAPTSASKTAASGS